MSGDRRWRRIGSDTPWPRLRYSSSQLKGEDQRMRGDVGIVRLRTILNLPDTRLEIVQGQVRDAVLERVQIHRGGGQQRLWGS